MNCRLGSSADIVSSCLVLYVGCEVKMKVETKVRVLWRLPHEFALCNLQFRFALRVSVTAGVRQCVLKNAIGLSGNLETSKRPSKVAKSRAKAFRATQRLCLENRTEAETAAREGGNSLHTTFTTF